MKLSVYKEFCCLEGSKTNWVFIFFNFSVLTSKRVVIHYMATVLKKKHKSERLCCSKPMCLFTPQPWSGTALHPDHSLKSLRKSSTVLHCNLMECFRVQLVFTKGRGRSEIHLPAYSAEGKVH